MGCGCGGGKRAQEMVRGTKPSNPIIYGADDATLPVRRVVLLQASAGVPAGSTRYIRGTEVQRMVDEELEVRATDGGKF